NLGIRNATGYYIYFFDSDDYLYPKHLETAVNMLQEENSDCVIFGFDLEGKKGKLGSYLPPSDRQPLDSFLMGRLWGYTPCILSRRELIKRVGFWNEELHISEDYDFLGRTLLTSEKC